MATSHPNNNNKAGELVSGRANHARFSVSSVQDDDADATTANALGSSDPSIGANVRCCCGDSDCAFFVEHLGLERDLDMAARMGQVCRFFFLFLFSFLFSSLLCGFLIYGPWTCILDGILHDSY